MLIEQLNKNRLLMERQEHDVSTKEPALLDYQCHFMLLEQKHKQRLLMARQEHDVSTKDAA